MTSRITNIFILTGIAAMLSLLFLACEEENLRKPVANDGTAPSPVTEVHVTNLPGGARVEYSIPADEDLLYVEATYLRGESEIVTSASVFNNVLLIEGLRSTSEQTVNLVSVDRGNNRSQPVRVVINPLTAPIDAMFNNAQIAADFGGVRLSFDNSNKISVEFQLFLKNEGGEFEYQTSAFIEDNKVSKISFRGYDPEPKTFGIVAIDRWDNITEMLTADLTPLEEELLSIDNFKPIIPKLSTDEDDAFGWVIENLWNSSIDGSGFHTSQSNPGHVVPPYTEPHHIISFDLGVTANLSRIKFWQRQGSWIFAHGNPRKFEIWGIDELPANGGTSLEGWTKLVENGEVIKPSGAPIGQTSAEDQAQAVLGEEFEVVNPFVPVRYIRFVNFESWSGGKFMHIMEFNFWGKVIE